MGLAKPKPASASSSSPAAPPPSSNKLHQPQPFDYRKRVARGTSDGESGATARTGAPDMGGRGAGVQAIWQRIGYKGTARRITAVMVAVPVVVVTSLEVWRRLGKGEGKRVVLGKSAQGE